MMPTFDLLLALASLLARGAGAWETDGFLSHNRSRYLADKSIWGSQDSCPSGTWMIPSNGRSTTSWQCCQSCPGGSSQCYSDCGCRCTSATLCSQLQPKDCVPDTGCTYTGTTCQSNNVGLTKGPQDSCPSGSWLVPSNGRSVTNWGCCTSCPGGTTQCYSDCGCRCSTATSCAELDQKSCLSGTNCVYDSSCHDPATTTRLPSTTLTTTTATTSTSSRTTSTSTVTSTTSTATGFVSVKNQTDCPAGYWAVPSEGRQRLNSSICAGCVDNQCFNDASATCRCSNATYCTELSQGQCLASIGCSWQSNMCMAGRCAWRQTGNCSGTGPREPQRDKTCDVALGADWSGFCDCNGDGVINSREVAYGCVNKSYATCADACGLQAFYTSTTTTTTTTVQAGMQSGTCAWRQTGNCSKTGTREPFNDKPCNVSIRADFSGFCDCFGDGVLDGRDFGYGCVTKPFATCADACGLSAPVTIIIPMLRSSAGVCEHYIYYGGASDCSGTTASSCCRGCDSCPPGKTCDDGRCSWGMPAADPPPRTTTSAPRAASAAARVEAARWALPWVVSMAAFFPYMQGGAS